MTIGALHRITPNPKPDRADRFRSLNIKLWESRFITALTAIVMSISANLP
ncbi:MAG: hypothetical protein KME42_16710 [Tildeniella nuda ZEHNDER 1965/U140]|jgi:hypothetical protein|nr:hypothetical protein [Tildeniella nuda ZEHNDER 1965/U140]